MGNRYNFFIDGEKVSSLDWNNRSMADIMPTYRWIIDNEDSNKLEANMDYSEAYYGGNSIKFTGNLEKDKASNIKLFSADLTLEDKTTFESTSSLVTESVEWSFPGAKTEGSTDKSPKISYEKEGIYKVTLKVKNGEGEDEKVIEEFITVKKGVNKGFELANLAKGAKAEASSFVNDNEAPKFALDGKKDTKWCATGKAPHSITIDLGSEKLVGEVLMGYTESGGESADMNTQKYTIEVSSNGKDFTEVASIDKNSLGNTVDTFKDIKARYVRINVIKPTQDSDQAVRIYEIQVRGQ